MDGGQEKHTGASQRARVLGSDDPEADAQPLERFAGAISGSGYELAGAKICMQFRRENLPNNKVNRPPRRQRLGNLG